MDNETVIKSLEKGIRIAEAAESGWVWITIEQARKVLEILREGNDER
jgi:exonuclease VII small subunit